MAIEKLRTLEQSKITLDQLAEELRRRGYVKAQKEMIYRKELAKKIMLLRSRGNNMPSGLAADIARGDEVVSQLRYDRDIAIIEFEACKDKLRNEKSQIEILRTIVSYKKSEMEMI